MPQSKERHAEYMREKRGSQEGSKTKGSQPEGSQDWETISIKEIKEILPSYLVKEIEGICEYDRLKQRNITVEGRFRRAYKYHLWHEANFIGGMHKDSKYRQFFKDASV